MNNSVGIVCAMLMILCMLFIVSTQKSNSTKLTPGQQIAEQNRQSAVATKLRQAEHGFVAEMKNGDLVRICINRSKVFFCDFVGNGNDPMELAKSVREVYGPESSNWGGKDGIAIKFIRGERTK